MSLDEHTLRVVARWLWLRAGIWEKRFQKEFPTDWHLRDISEEIENCGEFVREHGDLQRTRREKARRCEDCRWCQHEGYVGKFSISGCLKTNVYCEDARDYDSICGPSGKLWEDK